MNVSITIATQVPAGTSLNYRGGTIPFGYLLEDGSVISRTGYARLFEAIGTTYGAGDGSTTFKLPDSRGRADIGAGQGSGLTNRVLAATGGAETHTLTEAELASHTHIQNQHLHGVTESAHRHAIPMYSTDGSGFQYSTAKSAYDTDVSSPTYTDYTSTGLTVNNATAVNQNTGLNSAHNNMQPFLVATKIIKY